MFFMHNQITNQTNKYISKQLETISECFYFFKSYSNIRFASVTGNRALPFTTSAYMIIVHLRTIDEYKMIPSKQNY